MSINLDLVDQRAWAQYIADVNNRNSQSYSQATNWNQQNSDLAYIKKPVIIQPSESDYLNYLKRK